MSKPGLYQPLDYFLLRTPLLPVERYQALSSAETEQGQKRLISIAAADPAVKRALMVASTSVNNAIDAFADGTCSREAYLSGKVLRYLIRMSTRPTPFGMFAGVALGRWSDKTNIELTAVRKTRSRPDMTWLLSRILELERQPEIRRHLRMFANSCASVRENRIWLPHGVAFQNNDAQGAISIRATPIVLETLLLAQQPIRYPQLIDQLIDRRKEHPRQKVELLVDQLW